MLSIKTFILFLIFSISLIFPNEPPYLILISFDGFRWDYASKELTPNLNYIEENGVKALSLKPSFPSNTFPNHITIVTGLYPQNHFIISNNFYDKFSNEHYSITDTFAVRNPKWYKGEMIWETARRQGIITASYFWPGSELNLDYKRPNYFEYYEHKEDYIKRVNGVLDWLKLPYNKRPKFITLYFDLVDTYGHNYGPHSFETNKAVQVVDSVLGILLQGLNKLNLTDSVNLIVVSDHGMTDVSNERLINIEELVDNEKVKIIGKGAFSHIFAENNDLEDVYKKLYQSKNNFQVFKRNEIPNYFNFKDNPLIGDIFVLADVGWSIVTKKDLEIKDKYLKGNHGFDNNNLDMHGIFYAMGPSFKKGYKTGTINNIHIYPLLCKLLNIVPNQNIDGNLREIEFILK